MKVSKLVVVRIRGGVNVRDEVEDTLKMLRLTRPNHCTLVEDNSSRRGMLDKVKEMVTWGSVEPGVLEELLRKKGRLDDESITDETIQKYSSYKTVREFSEAVCEGEAELDKIRGLKKVFRLHPPKKGYRAVRRSFQHGGASGDRGGKIDNLISRMI